MIQPLARVGADVTGIDASADNIQMATHHANIDPRLAGRLKYQCCAVEDLSTNEAGVYDAVVASEILEHVNHQQEFINSCCRLVKVIVWLQGPKLTCFSLAWTC